VACRSSTAEVGSFCLHDPSRRRPPVGRKAESSVHFLDLDEAYGRSSFLTGPSIGARLVEHRTHAMGSPFVYLDVEVLSSGVHINDPEGLRFA
jgi:hypothetical protein